MDEEVVIEEGTCHAYHWSFRDRELEDGNHLCIDAWCLDRNSDPLLLRIENFPALCMIELPSYVNGVFNKWTNSDVSLLMDQLTTSVRGRDGPLSKYPPLRYKLAYLEKIYFYNGGRKYPFIQIFFKDLKSMYECKSKLSYPITTNTFGSLMLKVWETDVPPVRKLLTAKNMNFCQWFNFRGILTDEKISTIKEYILDYRDIKPISPEETLSWFTYPRIMSFDLECYSNNPKAFPNAQVVKDRIFMVSCIFHTYLKPELRKRYGIVLGKCDQIPEDVLPNCEIIEVKTEMELLAKMGELIKKHDPEIISGYNINKFDVPYIEKRMGMHDEELPNFSRIPSEPCEIKKTKWKSKAFGLVIAKYLEAQGRITFDIYPYAERQFKLINYTLDTVSKYLLKRGKHDVSPVYMFETHEIMQNCLKYVRTRDTDLTLTLAEAKERMGKVMRYCIEDAELCLDIFDKTNLWISSVEFASVSGINIADLYTRGQQISSFSLIYNEAAKAGYVINHVDLKHMNMSGGYVREPIKGLHKAITLDFTSLYPSIMISENMDHTTLVPEELYDQVPDEDCNVHIFDQEEKVVVSNPDGTTTKKKEIRNYRFKYYKKKEGITPRILRTLLMKRKEVQDKLKTEKDPLMRVVLDKRQLSYKIRANSLYGFFGAKDGKLTLTPVAASVTSVGRKHISTVDKYVMEHHNARIVYNDTDSSFIELIGVPDNKLEEKGRQIAIEVSALFKDPVKMEYEKAIKVLCLKKKKYAGLLIDKNGVMDLDKKNMMVKGIMSARRDNPQYSRDLYDSILYDSLIERPLYNIMRPLYDGCNMLLSGGIHYETLIITRVMGSSYKLKNYPLKIFSDRMKAGGMQISPGDRVEYLIVKVEGKKLLGERMIAVQMYKESLNTDTPYDLDYCHYMDKNLGSHIDQIVSLVYGEELRNTGISFQPNGKGKKVYIDNPVAFFTKLVDNGLEITVLEPMIEKMKKGKMKFRVV